MGALCLHACVQMQTAPQVFPHSAFMCANDCRMLPQMRSALFGDKSKVLTACALGGSSLRDYPWMARGCLSKMTRARSSVDVGTMATRRFKSHHSNGGMDFFQDLWALVPKEKEQVRLAQEIARVQQFVTEQTVTREKEMREQSFTREKELEKDIVRLETHLAYARKETLRSKGLLTSRGVIEFALRQVHHERHAGKKFFAQAACDDLDVTPPSPKTEAWKLHACFKEICLQYPGSSLAKKPVGKAYAELFSVLSHEIHGYPWSGESVRLCVCGQEACVGNSLCPHSRPVEMLLQGEVGTNLTKFNICIFSENVSADPDSGLAPE